MRALLRTLLLVPALALLGMGCARPAPVRQKLRLGWVQIPAYVLLYVAEDQGFFSAEGLDLERVTYGNGRDALAAALDGRVDLATVYPTPVLLQLFAGRDVVAITTLHRAEGSTGLVANPEAGIHSSADLRGKRVGVTPKTNADFVLDLLLAQASLQRSELNLVQGEQSALLLGLREGRLDAALLWAQNFTTATHLFRAGAPTQLTSDACTEVSMLAGDRAQVRRRAAAIRCLLRALQRAERYLDGHPGAVVQVLKKRFPYLTPGDLDRIRQQSRFELGVSNLALTMYRQEASWLEHQQGVPRAPSARVQSLFSPELLEEVAPESVTLLRRFPPAGGRR